MKHKDLLAVFAACAVVAFAGLPVPAVGDLGVSKAYAGKVLTFRTRA